MSLDNFPVEDPNIPEYVEDFEVSSSLMLGRFNVDNVDDFLELSEDRTLSRIHCEISLICTEDITGIFITNHSTNGTFVDGMPIGRDSTYSVINLDKPFQLQIGHAIYLLQYLPDANKIQAHLSSTLALPQPLIEN